jgi:hypothetical protein
MFVISRPRSGPIFVRTVEQIEHAIRSSPPGRYLIDRIAVDPLTSDRTSRHWGAGVKHDDGAVVIEPIPQEAWR